MRIVGESFVECLAGSAQSERIVTEFKPQRFNDETLGSRLHFAGTPRGHPLGPRHVDGTLRKFRGHEERKTGAHVESAVSLAIVVTRMVFDEFEHLGYGRDRVNAITQVTGWRNNLRQPWPVMLAQ